MFIFIIILMIAGMAVDLIRYEQRRVHLQNTADRAVLAAGSLRQPNDPESVVREYFEREGLGHYVTGVQVNEGLNFREVQVQTSAVVPTIFMKLAGVNQLVATSASAAEERYSKVEVSLVLDLSNSMNSFNRIENLRDAGAEFIDTLFQNAEPGQVSVSVIPYTGQVNPGPLLSGFYNISPSLTQSQCVDFAPSTYNSMSLSTTASLVGTGHFDPWHTSATPQMFFCPTRPGGTAEIVTMSGNANFLRTRMGQLTADGNTSIEIGVKWGAILLDPATRPIIQQMIDDGDVSTDFTGRPLDYDDPDVLKVMVIMTDGENFEQWILDDDVKTGPSDVFLNPNDDRISIFHPSRPAPNRFYVPHNGTWQNRPWGAPSTTNPGPVINLSYDQLWSRHSLRWVAWYLHAIPLGSNNTQRSNIYWDRVDNWLSRRPASQKNQHLETMCDTVKEQDIPVFTVAFEAPPVGVASMQMCATSPSHFFDVDGTDITRAFRAIAGTINQLRLTQ